MRKHKETFYQPAHDGLPPHWVVLFWDSESPFVEAGYFSTQSAALDFEEQLKKESLCES